MQISKILFRIVTVIVAITLITACSKETKKARLLGEANAYFKAGNYDKAKLAYINVLQLDPQNALAFERIGAMWQDDAAPLHHPQGHDRTRVPGRDRTQRSSTTR